jgi:hypothetical protein
LFLLSRISRSLFEIIIYQNSGCRTFLFIAQNLQSDDEGGRTWLTMSLLTGTLSFCNEECNLPDSLIAMT